MVKGEDGSRVEPHVPALWWIIINSLLEPVLVDDDMCRGPLPSTQMNGLAHCRVSGDTCLVLLGGPHCSFSVQEERTVEKGGRSCLSLTLPYHRLLVWYRRPIISEGSRPVKC